MVNAYFWLVDEENPIIHSFHDENFVEEWLFDVREQSYNLRKLGVYQWKKEKFAKIDQPEFIYSYWIDISNFGIPK